MFEFLRILWGRRSKRRFKDGSRIRVLNREFYEYREADGRRMEVEVCIGDGRIADRVIYSEDVRHWMPPHETDLVLPEKQKEILDKLKRYFEDGGESTHVDHTLRDAQ